MNIAFRELKEKNQNIVTWGSKCSLFLLNKVRKSMRGLFSVVLPSVNAPQADSIHAQCGWAV